MITNIQYKQTGTFPDFAVFFSYLFIGKIQKRAENVREAVAWSETFLQSCGNLSLGAKPSCKAAGTFRLERNFLAKLREPFAWSETLSQSCENLSLGATTSRKPESLFRSLRNLSAKLQSTMIKKHNVLTSINIV